MSAWAAMRSDDRNGTSVLGRAFRCLDALYPDGLELGLAELARRAELPKATTYRLAAQLVELGALERSGQRYRLGIRLFEMGSSVVRQRRLRDAALPFMEDLYEATHETIHLGVINDAEVLYIEKISGRRRSPVGTQVGRSQPLYCTALGKAILAFSSEEVVRSVICAPLKRHTPYTIVSQEGLMRDLNEIRANGVAYDREEFSLGIICVAAPLLDRTGKARAALSVTGPITRFNAEQSAAAVQTAARALVRDIAGSPWPL